jgi:uncharacterized protein (UPF0303 family)
MYIAQNYSEIKSTRVLTESDLPFLLLTYDTSYQINNTINKLMLKNNMNMFMDIRIKALDKDKIWHDDDTDILFNTIKQINRDRK